MNREIILPLGKRVSAKFTTEVEFGTVFGESVAEIQQHFISVCYIDVPSDDVLVPRCDMYIIHHSTMDNADPTKKEIAYRNISKRTANDLEKLLRYVIDGRITPATFYKEKAEIEETIKQKK